MNKHDLKLNAEVTQRQFEESEEQQTKKMTQTVFKDLIKKVDVSSSSHSVSECWL